MIEFKAGRYVSRIYFLCSSSADFDVMGCLYRDPGEPFFLVFRFRYYTGDQSKGPWEDGDAKSWTKVEFKRKDGTLGEEDEAIAMCSKTFGGLAAQGELDLHTLVACTDDSEKIAALLRAQPWVHMKPGQKPAEEKSK